MKRFGWITMCLLVAGGLLAGSWSDASAEAVQGKLIGTGKCKICHKQEKRGDQFGIWEKSSHAQAFATLGTDAAKAIAAEKGLGDPQQAPECLSCHVTQAFLGEGVEAMDTYSHEEGVGCEACHGAGSEYKSMSVMKDREAALAAGMQLHGPEHCVQCHNENSPTYKPFEYEARWKEIAHPVPTEG